MPDPTGFPMAVTNGTTEGNRTGTWRAYRPVYVQHTSPCREGCPAGEDIARWIDLLRAQQYRQAWEILTEDNPFPAVMGRICIHPCQSQCNRGQHDEALGINSLEQFLGDRALAEGWRFAPPAATRPQAVAVVGGGPAGLSCAYQLRRLGYRVTLFEASDRLGGQLAAALPEFQLPAAVLAAEVQRIVDLGVQVRLGVRVGRDIAWADLRQEHQAVFFATGAPQIPGPIGLPGTELPGVIDGLTFLRQVKRAAPQLQGLQAAVIGAGLTGIEAARTLVRCGATVTLVTAEPAESLTLPDRAAEAAQEGVTVLCGVQVQALSGADRVTGVALAGRELAADLVILATGRQADLELLPEEAAIDERWHVRVDPLTMATPMNGLFCGGDAAGTRYTVEAVGAGKRAAAAIHAYLQGRDAAGALAGARLGYSQSIAMRYYTRPESYPPQVRVNLQRVIAYEEIEALYFPRQERVERAWLTPEERRAGFAEGRLGLSEAEALAESQRCFNCGTCIGCDNCLIFCPDMAISKTADGAAFQVNWDYCKGCGACVQECPREALILEEEIK